MSNGVYVGLPDHVKPLGKLIEQVSYDVRLPEVFEDFVDVCYYSLCHFTGHASNIRLFGNSIVLPEGGFHEFREKLKAKYGKRFSLLAEAFEMLCTITNAQMHFIYGLNHPDAKLERPYFNDYLGPIFSMFGGANDHLGQFFTPYDVCLLMAGVVRPTGTRTNPLVLYEPACGSGATMIAAAHMQQDYQSVLNGYIQFHAADLSLLCCKMTAVQMILFGMHGHIYHMNSLSLEVFAEVTLPYQHRYDELYQSGLGQGETKTPPIKKTGVSMPFKLKT